MGGLADNVKDMIILTAGSQAFSLLSNWLWLLLLLAPLRAFYMLWTSVIAPWIFQPAEEDDEVSDKKRRKQERQMKANALKTRRHCKKKLCCRVTSIIFKYSFSAPNTQ